MGQQGKLIVAKKFASEHHLRNTLELYDELLSAPQPTNSGAEKIRPEWRLSE
jgi:hypothetical protein